MNEALHGDVNPHRHNGHRLVMGVSEPPSVIRVATMADMPFMVALAKEKYPNRPVEQGIPWMTDNLQSPNCLVLIGTDSVGVASISWNYGFERRARCDMLAARPVRGAGWEAYRMVKLMIEWAKQNGAKGAFRLDADTGADFGPFARRLGGTASTFTRYTIPLE